MNGGVTAKRICAWCGKHLGYTWVAADSKHPVTHGICEDCRNKLCAQWEMPLLDFLDVLGVPVACLDEHARIRGANGLGRAFLGCSTSDLQDRLWGDALGCVHASEEGGCGNTPSCKTCAIRNAVLHTHKTGESVVDRQATAEVDDGSGPQTLDLRISTEKSGDLVLLRVEGAPSPRAH